jgi:hypothetical protein
MYIAEIAVLSLVLVISGLIQVYINYRITQIGVSQLAGRVEALNQALGDALSGLAESGMLTGNAPQVNPIMEIIGEVLKNQMKEPTLQVTEVARSDDGKFTSVGDKL